MKKTESSIEPKTGDNLANDKVRLLEDGLLTVKEAAAISRRCVSSLYLSMDAGELAYVRWGRSRRIPRRALMEHLARCMSGGWAANDSDGETKKAG